MFGTGNSPGFDTKRKFHPRTVILDTLDKKQLAQIKLVNTDVLERRRALGVYTDENAEQNRQKINLSQNSNSERYFFPITSLNPIFTNPK